MTVCEVSALRTFKQLLTLPPYLIDIKYKICLLAFAPFPETPTSLSLLPVFNHLRLIFFNRKKRQNGRNQA